MLRFFEKNRPGHAHIQAGKEATMPFSKNESLAGVSRKNGTPYPTLYWWVRVGRVVMPGDEVCLGRLRKNKQKRYYRKEE
jgi:hypothetical protein